MIVNNYKKIYRKKLPSFNSKNLSKGDSLDSMYRYLYLDALYKESCTKKTIPECNRKLSLDELTVIITHTDAFLNKQLNFSLKNILEYYQHMGVSNIIVYNTTEDDLTKFKSVFKKFHVLSSKICPENKSQIINESLKKVNTNYVLICDDNSFISIDNFYQSFNLLSTYDFVYPSFRCVRKVSRLNDFLEDYDYNSLDSGKRDYINYDYNYIFCNFKSLLNIGAYNSFLKSEKIISDELNLRINLSDFSVCHVEEALYLLGFVNNVIDEDDESILVKEFNLSKLNDLNLLIYQNREMFDFYYNSIDDKNYTFDNDYKISVIIPTYNCEEYYLDRCISSLMNQSIGFENLEIIIIDDASKINKSKEIIRNYDDKYENIKAYFLKDNRGAGIARNTGLENATADYICFLDHDNYYVYTFCENVYNYMEREEVDIFIGNYIDFNIKSKTLMMSWHFLNLTGDEEFLNNYKDDLNIFWINPTIWAKGYKKDFLNKNNIRFSDYRVAEDNLFNTYTLIKANGIYIKNIPSIIYDFRDNDDDNLKSISLIYTKDLLINRLKAYKEIFKLSEKYFPEISYAKHINSLVYCTKSYLLIADFNRSDFNNVVKEISETYKIAVDEEMDRIPQQFRQLFKNIAYREYDEAYKFYLKYKLDNI